jgi:AcrR family transcriptional regulator
MSPKNKEQFKEIRQRSRAAIKEAALELFARNGYQSTSISQIAKEAGISKGLIYNYFDSKEALLEAIVLEVIEDGERLMGMALEQYEQPGEQLRFIIESSFQMVHSNIHFWKLMTSLAFQTDALKGLEPILKRKQELALGKAVAIFEGLGVAAPRKEAYFFGAVLDGIFVHYLHMEDDYPLEEMKDFILKRFVEKPGA